MSNVEQEYILKLKEKTPFSEVEQILAENNVIKNKYIFDLTKLVANAKIVPKGYYKLTKSMTSLDLIRKLRNGQQDPIRFTISTGTFIEDIAARVGQKMQFDSSAFMDCLLSYDNKLKYNYDEKTVLTHFLPNTIDIYWTYTSQQFVDRWMTLYDKFWNTDRKSKAAQLNLTQEQSYTLASLVQKEYARKDERSRIAGVLINRLKQNMPLQVDATCKYATRDFAAKRVMHFHTSYPSEYNTYQNLGLPPGPICIPEIETIDAVLSPESHDNIFYCADPSLNGYHIFSKTLADHENIAKTYREKMDAMGVK